MFQCLNLYCQLSVDCLWLKLPHVLWGHYFLLTWFSDILLYCLMTWWRYFLLLWLYSRLKKCLIFCITESAFPRLIIVYQRSDCENFVTEIAPEILKRDKEVPSCHLKLYYWYWLVCCVYVYINILQLLTEGTDSPKQGASDDPTVWLDRLAAVFR